SYGLTTRLLGRGPTAAESPAAAAPAPVPVDPETLPQGLSAGALPDFVGPPVPPAAAGGAPPAAAAPRELVRASILHGYDLSRALVGNSHASDIDLGVRLTPLDYLGFTYNTTVSVEQREIRGLSTGIFMREPWWTPPNIVRNFQSPTTIGLSYRFVQSDVNRSAPSPAVESPPFNSDGVNELHGPLYLRLAGGLGTRLLPLTRITNKHLLPVFDRPMIFYPIQTLINAGITDILLVTGGPHAGDFLRLLGDGREFGLKRLNYTYQEGEGGIPAALSLAEHFADGERLCVILGDNLIEGWWTDAGTFAPLHRAGNLVAQTGANLTDGPATREPGSP